MELEKGAPLQAVWSPGGVRGGAPRASELGQVRRACVGRRGGDIRVEGMATDLSG